MEVPAPAAPLAAGLRILVSISSIYSSLAATPVIVSPELIRLTIGARAVTATIRPSRPHSDLLTFCRMAARILRFFWASFICPLNAHPPSNRSPHNLKNSTFSNGCCIASVSIGWAPSLAVLRSTLHRALSLARIYFVVGLPRLKCLRIPFPPLIREFLHLSRLNYMPISANVSRRTSANILDIRNTWISSFPLIAPEISSANIWSRKSPSRPESKGQKK